MNIYQELRYKNVKPIIVINGSEVYKSVAKNIMNTAKDMQSKLYFPNRKNCSAFQETGL